MKRPQRILTMLVSSGAVIWLVLRLMPVPIALGALAAALLLLVILMVWARHYLIGRYRARRRRWPKAIESYQRFEQMLLTNRHSHLLMPLYMGIYTLDGVAVTRNLIAQALMRLDKLDEAEGWLRSALQRDPLFAVPYANLGVIAAVRREEAQARRHSVKAVELGFNPVGAQQMLARALARGRQALDTDR